MTNQQHPLIPPPELVEEWNNEAAEIYGFDYRDHIATQAAQWGADQELEACCVELAEYCDCGVELTSGRVRELLMELRRPKPPSLAEGALAALQHAEKGWRPVPADCNTIRRALERLQQLEEQQ